MYYKGLGGELGEVKECLSWSIEDIYTLYQTKQYKTTNRHALTVIFIGMVNLVLIHFGLLRHTHQTIGYTLMTDENESYKGNIPGLDELISDELKLIGHEAVEYGEEGQLEPSHFIEFIQFYLKHVLYQLLFNQDLRNTHGGRYLERERLRLVIKFVFTPEVKGLLRLTDVKGFICQTVLGSLDELESEVEKGTLEEQYHHDIYYEVLEDVDKYQFFRIKF